MIAKIKIPRRTICAYELVFCALWKQHVCIFETPLLILS